LLHALGETFEFGDMTAFGCSDPIFQVLRFAFSKDAQEVLTELIRCGQILTGLTHLLELPLLSSSEFLQQGSKQVASGSFLYSHPNITLPAKGKIYSINEAYETLYDESTRAYLALLKASADYTARYVGSLVADAYRTLLKGGIFLSPRNRKQPDGRLRLMLELNPHALLIEQAGGMAITSDGKSPLTIVPKTLDDHASLIMSSRENVEAYAGFLNG